MRKTNIAFSGFMAAILFSAGAANAATQIASKQYVDNRETSILQTVSNTYETKENVTNLTEQVTQLGDTINNEDTGLAAKVDDAAAAAAEAKQTADTAQSTATGAQTAVEALGATVGNAEAGLVKDVNDLETSVSGLQTTVGQLDTAMDSKLDSATAATTYEVLSNKTNDLATDAGSTDKYPSAKAVVDWVSNTVTEGIEINTDKIQNGAITTDKLGNGAVTGDKIGADAVNGDKIADDSIGAEHIKDGAVNSDAIADGSVTGTDIADATISAGKLDTALNAEIDGKEDKSNKATVINSTNQASTDAYPSVKAVYDWTTQQIANVEFDPSTDLGTGSVSGDKIADGAITGDKIADDAIDADAIADNAVGTGQIQNGAVTGDKIADGAVGTDDIADGAVTSDKLDETLAGQIADISGKQDIAMGVGHENHIVTTDASGNITSAATIGQDKVTGLTDALAAKADASALEEIEQNVTNVTQQYETINETVTDLGDTINNEENGLTQQITNITQQIGNAESGLVKDITDAKNAADAAADAAGAAQGAVDALETTVDGKADKATTLAGYGITDAYTKTETDGLLDAKADETALANYATTTALTSGLALKEDTANKTKLINDGNKSSETLFPTIGAITTWTDQQIQKLSTDGIPVNPDNIGSNAITTDKIANGAVTTEKLADDSVTEDKLSNDVVASIDAKLPAPDADCVADSNLCVLTVTPSGDLAWVAVTQPAE